MCEQSRATFCKQTSCAWITYDININKTYILKAFIGGVLWCPQRVSPNRTEVVHNVPRRHRIPPPDGNTRCDHPTACCPYQRRYIAVIPVAHTYSVGTANIWKGFQRSTWLHLQITLHTSSAWQHVSRNSTQSLEDKRRKQNCLKVTTCRLCEQWRRSESG